ncbi:MAG: hypothetical protein HKN47_22700 [Pirellulaceae bacterium]|nr:hypothetical protein [Pirellulaceae bacterium]
MKIWIDRILIFALVVVLAVLTATALPVLFGGHLGGMWLLAHMIASGALVFGLPVVALIWMWPNLSSHTSGAIQRLGFWSLITTGLLTIATVGACMLPFPSTETMHQLIQWHGYAGFAMVPALAVLLWGIARWRRIQSTRSVTPG